MRDLKHVLQVTLDAAKQAGKFIVAEREKGEFHISFKGERDLVTEADLGAEKIILSVIRAAFPNDAILSEEASPNEKDFSGPLWIIDPIDGTTNFAQGHPQVGVSIAFSEGGLTQVGVVHAPFLNETFSAIRGSGSWLNDKRLQVVDETKFSRALVGTGFPYKRDKLGPLIKRLENVLAHCRDLRRLGAASLDISWVACGRLQGFYESLSPWDMAAACLIAREAGARVGHIYGLPADAGFPEELYGLDLIVACPGIYEELLQHVKVPLE